MRAIIAPKSDGNAERAMAVLEHAIWSTARRVVGRDFASSHRATTPGAQRNIPFRVLAKKFGVSVRTAPRLCVGRS
jgi:hypothetical protein